LTFTGGPSLLFETGSERIRLPLGCRSLRDKASDGRNLKARF
jgi:hypothetical protein